MPLVAPAAGRPELAGVAAGRPPPPPVASGIGTDVASGALVGEAAATAEALVGDEALVGAVMVLMFSTTVLVSVVQDVE